MRELKRCLEMYNEQTHVGCDFYAGHAGPCSDVESRRARIAELEGERRALEDRLTELRTGHRPRNRADRRAAVQTARKGSR